MCSSDLIDVVKRIESIGTANGSDGPPKQPVVIKKVTIGAKG